MRKCTYTNESITEQEWNEILGLQLPEALIKLLAFLRSLNGEPVSVKNMPSFFRSSHPEQLNAKLSTLKVPYRIGTAHGKRWTHVPWDIDIRAFKLYKVKLPEKNGARAKVKWYLCLIGRVQSNARVIVGLSRASPLDEDFIDEKIDTIDELLMVLGGSFLEPSAKVEARKGIVAILDEVPSGVKVPAVRTLRTALVLAIQMLDGIPDFPPVF